MSVDTIKNVTKDATSITRVTNQEEGTSTEAISQTDNIIALTTKTTEETTSTSLSPLPASTSQENTSITTRRYETVPQASDVRGKDYYLIVTSLKTLYFSNILLPD